MINLLIASRPADNIKIVKPKTVNANTIRFIYIDLFCGAGGTSTGLLQAKINGDPCAIVAACVNHDPKAIRSHWMNHPEVYHFEEDITKMYGMVKHNTFFMAPDMVRFRRLIDIYRAMYPNAKVILWASLECTNFSKAKGGQPRDADSRTLANHLDRYIHALEPDFIQIENVVEFMAWGPMRIVCKKSHKEDLSKSIYANSELKFIFNKKKDREEYAWTPISKKNGLFFREWESHINSIGYRSDWRELNSADFGAYTSRNRLFGCFAKGNLSIAWPVPTHSKKLQSNNLFDSGLSKWKAVKDVLDFEDEGISIFNRKKPLVDNTLERVYAGLVKFVAGGKDAFLLQYNSGSVENRAIDIEGPCNTIPTENRFALAQTSFIAKYYSGKPAGKVIPVTGPAGTIPTAGNQSLIICKPFILRTNFSNQPTSIDEPAPTLLASRRHHYVVNPSFLAKYYGNGDNIGSIDEPAGTLTTKDRFTKVQPVFLEKTYSGKANIQSIESPAGTIMPNDKHRLINCQPFILNPSHGGHCTGTENPCPVIIARQDKAPLYLIQFQISANVQIPVYEGDSEVMVRIKKFMALYGLVDIKMRMLKVSELLPIQGFPIDYKLFGSQTDHKKFIGNSVVPHVVKSWTEAMALSLNKWNLN